MTTTPPGGSDPYADPVLYDLEYADQVEDIAHYVDRARTAGGAVLELGCGTGRLTLPIARAGVTVCGIDRSATMLAGLAEKLAREPEAVRARVTLVTGDYVASDPVPNDTFSAVLWPFNALHHCPVGDQVVAVLERAQRWTPNGRLHLDCYLPDRILYDRDPEARYESRWFVHPVTGETLQSWEQGWWDEATRVHNVVYVYAGADGQERRTHLQLHMYERDELHGLMRRGGWHIARAAQDFRGTPINAASLKWVATLTR